MTMTREQVAERAPDALFADGFDDCLIGTVRRFNDTVALYDYEKVIAVLMKDGLNRMDAEEHFDFNIVGAWVGENTPAFATMGEGK